VLGVRVGWLVRRRALSTLAVAVLIGIAGGAVLSALAGARRTSSAFSRFLDRTNEPDETIAPLDFRDLDEIDAAKIRRLPGVARAGSALGFVLASRTPDGQVFVADNADALASEDGISFYEIGRGGDIDGRMPREGRIGEVAVTDVVARDYGLAVGSSFEAGVARYGDLLALSHDATAEQFTALFRWIDLTVVGIAKSSTQFLANENQERGAFVFGPAFAREFRDYGTYRVIGVDLADPGKLARFERALRSLYDDVPLQLTSRLSMEATFDRVVRPYVDALRLFAIVAATTGLLVIAQALVRLVAADGGDGSVLRAFGATRRQRAAAAAARACLAIGAGALLAVALAIAISPLFPVGASRDAELDTGIRVDPMVLGAGAAALVLLLALVVGWTSWRRARPIGSSAQGDERAWRPSALADRAARLGMPVSAVTGVRFAIERDRAHGSVPLATTLFGLVAAIITIGAALTYGVNLDRLVTTPEQYGWNWDTLIDPGDEGADDELVAAVRDDSSLTAVTVGSRAVLPVDGRALPAYAFRRVRGHAELTALEGRLPRSADEIAIGGQSLDALGRDVGETVVARTPDGTATKLRIVGRTVFPSLSLNATYSIGEGVALTAAGLRVLEPNIGPSFFLVDVRAGTTLASVRARYGDELGVDGVQRPGDISSYASVRITPVVLAALLAVLGIGVLAHLLVVSIDIRRRDLAMMKTLGCTRRQLGLAVAWQATTLVVAALVAGIPLGVAAGRLTWREFAGDLGIGSSVVVPSAAFLGIVVVGVVAANLIAVLPARAAARTTAATVLRVRDQ
jgi:ABC-type lipoprotein release transport system permease subunit